MTSQFNRDLYFMRIALLVAERSKCLRAKYGSVLVSSDGRIVSTGYNGKPRDSKNDDVCYRQGLENNASKPNCCLHSEMNCLFFASPEERIGATLYVSGVPCTDCALMIAQSKVDRLVYLNAPSGNHTGNFDFGFLKDYGMKFSVFTLSKEDLE